MANGVYANAGIDSESDSDGLVNNVVPGPLVITKTGDGAGGNIDPDVLDTGDTFTVNVFPGQTFTYVGTDGSGGILATTNSTSDNFWFSDDPITVGDTVPALVSGNTTICFAAGTLIAVPEGETAVEELQIGDMVLTAEGRSVPVKWIGHQTVHKLFTGPRMQPVRIRAGALGGGLPHSDLTVTGDHGMIVDGLVINASALVNGSTIDWVPLAELPDRFTYYHVETEDHDVILANGAPAETFVDYVGRQAFDNYGEYFGLYGAERIIPEMDRPRIAAQRLVPDAIRARLGIVEPEIDWGAPLSA